MEVETSISNGLPYHIVVGLGNAIIKESKDRVKSAIINSGLDFPDDKITQNLYPTDIRKSGSHLDLPIAIGIILAKLEKHYDDMAFIGELSLDGRILRSNQIMSLILVLKNNGIRKVVLPTESLEIASAIEGVEFYAYSDLKTLVNDLKSGKLSKTDKISLNLENKEYELDFSQVVGQEKAVRVASIASVIGANFLMLGPPGCGKTMIAKRIISILPPLDFETALTIHRIYETTTYGNRKSNLVYERPIRTPHHSITAAGLIGSHIAGECAKSHGGILLLDEITEYRREVLEALREPLEDKEIVVTKNNITTRMPADFMLVATMNNCKCGDDICRCTLKQKKDYARKISKPIIDRIDLGVRMYKAGYGGSSQSSKEIREKIINAKEKLSTIKFSKEGEEFLTRIYLEGKISMRVANKLKNIGIAIAALENKDRVEKIHLLEGFGYNTERAMEDVLNI